MGPPPMSVSMPLHRHFISRCIPRPLPHRRKIHAPSTENPPSIDGAYHPVNATFIRAQTPRHAHTSLSSPSHRLPNVLLFFFFRILSHQFPIRSSASTTTTTTTTTTNTTATTTTTT